MKVVMDRSRKQLSIWSETFARLKRVSEETGETMTALLHEAVTLLEAARRPEEREDAHA